jgi:mono/diheme cytochrome c family protein
MLRRCPLRTACVAAVSLLLSTAPAWAVNRQALDAGKQLYNKYCATCHGHDAKGKGPLTGSLNTAPPDLTLLAKKQGGKFPYMDVLDILDGAVPYPAHGNSELPAWGDTFQSDDPGSTGGTMEQAAVRGRLMLITDYLRSIQAR